MSEIAQRKLLGATVLQVPVWSWPTTLGAVEVKVVSDVEVVERELLLGKRSITVKTMLRTGRMGRQANKLRRLVGRSTTEVRKTRW